MGRVCEDVCGGVELDVSVGLDVCVFESVGVCVEVDVCGGVCLDVSVDVGAVMVCAATLM